MKKPTLEELLKWDLSDLVEIGLLIMYVEKRKENEERNKGSKDD